MYICILEINANIQNVTPTLLPNIKNTEKLSEVVSSQESCVGSAKINILYSFMMPHFHVKRINSANGEFFYTWLPK